VNLSERELKSLEDRVKREWDASPVLREEFGGEFNAYLAYKRAMAEQRINVLGHGRKHA
jgi:hypothetical protein